MMKKPFRKYLLLVATLLSNMYAHAQQSWVRYNLSGYDPIRIKRAIVMSDVSLTGTTWTMKNMAGNTVANGSFANSLAAKGDYMPKAFNYAIDFSSVTTEGEYTLTVGNLNPVILHIKCQPYKGLLSQILRTIRVRRSASEDALDHAISHLGDTSCTIHKRIIANAGDLGKSNSGTDSWKTASPLKKANLVGGYYDAGDYIKFTLTNAHLTYFMLRSYETAPELFDGVKLYSKTSLDDLLDNAKWGLDFLARCMIGEGEFIIQTGGELDHKQPLRLPENDLLNGKRECYAALSKPQMGLAAAALALGSKILGAKGWNNEANLYKTKAIQIYEAAKASTELPAWWQTTASGGEVYYSDKTENDNMELAAIELYLLTSDPAYLTDATSYGTNAGAAYWSSWGVYNMPAHLRIYQANKKLLAVVTQDLGNFNANATRTNNLWKIPHESVWGSLYSQLSVACSAIQFQMVSNNNTYAGMGYDVADYLLGRNPWGLGFVATKDFANTITSSYAVIYRLQPTKFPYGEIAEGPATANDYAINIPYFNPPHDQNLWHSQFNTSAFTFFEQPGDYISMETTIGGLADGLYLLTLISKNVCDAPLGIQESSEDKSGIRIYAFQENSQTMLRIDNLDPESTFDIRIYDTSGILTSKYENQKNDTIALGSNLKGGIYLVSFKSARQQLTTKIVVKK